MKPRRAGLFVAGAIAALACATAVQMIRDRQYSRETHDVEKLLYVRSGAVLQRIALSFDALLADVYWIRAIQHFGGQRLLPPQSRRYDLLYPLLDLTTSLDPYFRIAYRFGAIFLSEKPPGGPGRPDLSIALLQKGMAAQPEKWEYPYDIGFVHYWQHRDFTAAADWFDRASKRPNAPNWIPALTAAMHNAAGDRSTARMMWRQMLESDQAWLRSSAQRRLAQLDALDLADRIHAVIRRYPPGAGQPFTWADYVRRGILRGIPVDPTGAPFELDPATGAVRVSPESDLQPMPDEARRTLS